MAQCDSILENKLIGDQLFEFLVECVDDPDGDILDVIADIPDEDEMEDDQNDS